jgi:DNA-binding Lrp family transcriptional regulator
LLCVARNPDSRVRDIADFVGVTERAAHTLVSDLREAGYLERQRIGIRNHYELRLEAPLSDPGLDARRLGDLLDLLGEMAGDPARPNVASGGVTTSSATRPRGSGR